MIARLKLKLTDVRVRRQITALAFKSSDGGLG